MTPGQQIRIKPGLVSKPAISGRMAIVIAAVNDRLRVQVGPNQYLVEKEDVER